MCKPFHDNNKIGIVLTLYLMFKNTAFATIYKAQLQFAAQISNKNRRKEDRRFDL